MENERSFRTFDDLEVREADDGALRFQGHVAKFDKLSEDLGFREKIAPGAFRKTIKESDIRFLLNHDPNFVLGRNRAGTLSLKEDDTGLLVDGVAPNTQWARDLRESVQRGDINQGSFGFRTIRDEWDEKKEQRTLLEVQLFDVSLVTYPAYEDTNVAARASDHANKLAAALRSGAEIGEEDQELLRRLLGTATPHEGHEHGSPPDGHLAGDELSGRARLTDLERQIQLARAS